MFCGTLRFHLQVNRTQEAKNIDLNLSTYLMHHVTELMEEGLHFIMCEQRWRFRRGLCEVSNHGSNSCKNKQTELQLLLVYIKDKLASSICFPILFKK